MFALYTAPAVNLFEKTTDRVAIRSNQHEYQVIPDRSRYLDFEPHRMLDVYAHYPGGRDKVPVRPLYSAPVESGGRESGLWYTVRRLPRRRTVEEKKYGASSDYTGTDMFISLVEPAGIEDDRRRLRAERARAVLEPASDRASSGRRGRRRFPPARGRRRSTSSASLGPTPPRGPVVGQLRSRSETAHTGTVTWRLINMLSLNHLGLVERGAGQERTVAASETLSMFADLQDSATERKIRGIRSVDSRPVGAARAAAHRQRHRARHRSDGDARREGVRGKRRVPARRDPRPLLLRISALNHFTQTVIRTTERGEIMRWPVRIGLRRPL